MDLSNSDGFYRTRSRIYTALLVFVVVVGLPIIGVPALRHRLASRVDSLREAFAGRIHTPAVAKVGENSEPFPSEYEHPFVPPQMQTQPQIVLTPPSRVYNSTQILRPQGVVPSRQLRIPSKTAEQDSVGSTAPEAQSAENDASGNEAQPQYRRGSIEKEAYDLLLSSNSAVAGMVNGSNPSLKFKSWEAAKRQDDSFWVRLVFVQSPDAADVEYIWQVKLLSKEIIPLSHNARSLPKS